MSIERAGNSCLGLGNQSFPLWDLGATMYWRSVNSTEVQTPGGTGTVTFSYSEPSDDYYVFDPGKGFFRQVDPATQAEFPPDGFVGPDRTNLWDNTQDSTRGFTTIDVGFATSNPAIDSSHILDPTSTSLATGFRVQNSSGGALRLSRSEGISTSFNRIFSVLLHRSDDGVIDNSVATLYAATTHGGVTEAGSTLYRKVRQDGWYELTVVRTADASSGSRYFGIEIQDGYTIDIEMPGLEGTNATIQQGAFPSPDIGTSDNKGEFELTIARGVAAGSEQEPYLASGWIGCTVVHPYSSADVTLDNGILIDWAVDSSNFIQIRISGSVQHIAAEGDSGGVDQFFLDVPGPPTINIGDVNGIVLSWGRRRTTDVMMLFINGQQIELTTSFDLPVGMPAGLGIGFDTVSGGTVATANIQTVATGRRLLTRTEARHLSSWFQKQTFKATGTTETLH